MSQSGTCHDGQHVWDRYDAACCVCGQNVAPEAPSMETLRAALAASQAELERLRERVLELKEAETHCTRLYREQVSEVKRLREERDSWRNGYQNATAICAAEAGERYKAESALATVTAERDRLRQLLHSGEWFRCDNDGRTHLAVRVADFADLSCKATRDDAIDAALAALAEPRKGE